MGLFSKKKPPVQLAKDDEVFHPVHGPGHVTEVTPERTVVDFGENGKSTFYDIPKDHKGHNQMHPAYVGGAPWVGHPWDRKNLTKVTFNIKERFKLMLAAALEKDFETFEEAVKKELNARGAAAVHEMTPSVVSAILGESSVAGAHKTAVQDAYARGYRLDDKNDLAWQAPHGMVDHDFKEPIETPMTHPTNGHKITIKTKPGIFGAKSETLDR